MTPVDGAALRFTEMLLPAWLSFERCHIDRALCSVLVTVFEWPSCARTRISAWAAALGPSLKATVSAPCLSGTRREPCATLRP